MVCPKCASPIKKNEKSCPNCGWYAHLCSNCGRQLKENWKYCPFCKVEIIREQNCARCGKEFEPGWVICPFCGVNNIHAKLPDKNFP